MLFTKAAYNKVGNWPQHMIYISAWFIFHFYNPWQATSTSPEYEYEYYYEYYDEDEEAEASTAASEASSTSAAIASTTSASAEALQDSTTAAGLATITFFHCLFF